MELEAKKCLYDVQKACREIEAFTAELTFEEFRANAMVRAAVERKFEIVGEALNRLARTNSDILEQIHEHPRIIGFRNVIAHGYDVVDVEIVWEVVRGFLPRLRDDVDRLLDV